MERERERENERDGRKRERERERVRERRWGGQVRRTDVIYRILEKETAHIQSSHITFLFAFINLFTF